MPEVHLSGPNNSTMFTDCCDCAIRDVEAKCPCCGQFIFPFYEDNDLETIDRNKVHKARWDQAYGPYRRKNA